jgi:hypothetical protein
VVDEDEPEPEGSDGSDEGGASLISRAAPAMGVVLLALIIAVAAGAGTYIVNRESSTDDHADEAQATARVFLPEYVKARDGLVAMKKRGRAYVYHYDTTIPLPDLKVLAFAGSTAEIGAIAAAQTKLRAVWPAGASAPRSGAALKRRWKRSPALRRQVADALTSVNAAVGGLTRVAG